jgi:hypothetical protein
VFTRSTFNLADHIRKSRHSSKMKRVAIVSSAIVVFGILILGGVSYIVLKKKLTFKGMGSALIISNAWL